ncbi:NUDIX domain-containing protein [Streptomyces sp. NPDC059816]|uniref:NUDIX domain-containing protein n=1 Tax=Streptomyces sp. NPDC059816 TaxID=3346960 RepID=UPI003658ABE8
MNHPAPAPDGRGPAPPPTAPCAAAVISHQDRTLLVQRRAPQDELVWQFPSVRVADGEQPDQAAVRAARTVAGVDAVAHGVLGDRNLPKAGQKRVYVGCFLAEDSRPAYRVDPQEVAGTAWITNADVAGYLAGAVDGPVRKYLGLDQERPSPAAWQGTAPLLPSRPTPRSRNLGPGSRGGHPALFLPSGGDRGLAVLRHAAAGGSLWDAARALEAAYWDVRDVLSRTVRGLCPEEPLKGPVPVPQWLVRPVTRAVGCGLITAEHVPAPAGGPLVLDGANQQLAELAADGLTDVQIARQLGRTADETEHAVRALQDQAAAAHRAHLAAVLVLHSPAPSSVPAARPQPPHRQDS